MPPWVSRTSRISLSASARLGQLCLDGVGLHAVLFQRGEGLARLCLRAPVDDDVRALAGQSDRDLPPDASRANPSRGTICPVEASQRSDLRVPVGVGDERRGPAVGAPGRDVHRPLAAVQVGEHPHLPAGHVLLADHDALVARVPGGRHRGRIGDVEHPRRRPGRDARTSRCSRRSSPAPGRFRPAASARSSSGPNASS